MATWTAYLIAVVTWIAWMAGFAVLDYTLNEYVLDLALKIGGDFVAAPVGWVQVVLSNWAIIGAAGIFLSLVTAAVASPGGLGS